MGKTKNSCVYAPNIDNHPTSEVGDIGRYKMLPKYNDMFVKGCNAGILKMMNAMIHVNYQQAKI